MRIAAPALAATLASMGIAGADPATEHRADALAAEGRKLSDAHAYEDACAKLGEAIALAPDEVETMLDLGVCNEHLKKYATALSWYRRTRAFARSHGLAKIEATSNAHVNSVAARVAVAKIVFRGSRPKGVRVTVDGYPLVAADYERVELDQGSHAIDATAPRYEKFHADLDVEDSQIQTVEIALEPTQEDEPKASERTQEDEAKAPEAVTEAPGPNPRRRLARNLAIGGGAALVAGAAIGIYARVEYDQCVSNGVPRAKCTNGADAVESANYYHNVARWVATPVFGVGAALVGYATYVYLTAPSDSHHVAWVPIIDADRFGIAAVGQF